MRIPSVPLQSSAVAEKLISRYTYMNFRSLTGNRPIASMLFLAQPTHDIPQ